MNLPFLPGLISLINSVAVIMILAYFFQRSRFYQRLHDEGLSWDLASPRRTLNSLLLRLGLIAFFGVISIYGTLSGVTLPGGIIFNIRDLGPMIAGFTCGPLVGLGAGLIGAAHRYTLGGYTMMAGVVGTTFAGLTSGLIYRLMRRSNRRVTFLWATVSAFCIECVHLSLIFVFCAPFDKALSTFETLAPAMILANTLGIGIFFFFLQNLNRERELLKAKRFMEGELQVAREIQMSIVPRSFPAFPERPEFEIFALLEPAREVGGDFYDFMFLDDTRLFFVVGDVSGKGLPASLFMAVTRTLLRSQAQQFHSPSAIMSKVNEELCRDNEAAMFVTSFCGVFDTVGRRLDYCNAGHNPPVIRRAEGQTEEIAASGNIALGIDESRSYLEAHIDLNAGDLLFLYTDGVTEAMNAAGQLYGAARMRRYLENGCNYPLTDLLKGLRADMSSFEAGAAPADDITMLGIQMR